ncbi:ASST-domain-containing protein [Pseudomassariella vexata]|uniref:ASST-domain-containing protein n=1 Tax=Pseudomassariella vexata TaxID=1141098 RepID=A0A1Y2EA47_9PEZI|nr:ASST-domain-containing protein [Pseudomassariella vexata]ORY67735.1 ASST-domain-containing protein [Pseudomassariella vexata]
MFNVRLLFIILASLISQVAASDEFSPSYDAYNSASYGARPDNIFHSTDIVAPLLQINTWNHDAVSTAGSHIFLRHDGEKSSPLILNAGDLSVVYVNRSYEAVFDLRVQQSRGQNYLTFYAGPIVDGHGNGYGLVLNEAYELVHMVSAQNLSVHSDLHEFQLTGHGTALVTAYEKVKKDLKPWRGSKYGYIVDSVFQEIDLETNELLFMWRASDHIDLADSYQKVGQDWDFFHINSITKTTAGNYLISARHMHSIYLISGTTGDILWTLGGKKNDFIEPNRGIESGFSNDALAFAWQHHARFFHGNESELTFFDNHVLVTTVGCKQDCSRGVHVALDTSDQKTVTLLQEYLHPQSLQAQSQGSVQPLEGGNVFVGWGRSPSFTEHDAQGNAVLDVQFAPWHSKGIDSLDNYRAYKMDWTGQPKWPPSVAAVKDHKDNSKVYVSWNGATEVREWVLLASESRYDLNGFKKVVARVPKSGFETSFDLGPNMKEKFARVAALDVEGMILGSTGIVQISTGRVSESNTEITSVVQTEAEAAESQSEDDDEDKYDDHGSSSVATTMDADIPGAILFPKGVHIALGLVMIVGLVLVTVLS